MLILNSAASQKYHAPDNTHLRYPETGPTSPSFTQPSHVQELEIITFIICNPDLRLAFCKYLIILENHVLEGLSKFSTSKNTANIFGSWAGSY